MVAFYSPIPLSFTGTSELIVEVSLLLLLHVRLCFFVFALSLAEMHACCKVRTGTSERAHDRRQIQWTVGVPRAVDATAPFPWPQVLF